MSSHVQSPCFLCEQLVSIHDLAHMFIPGKSFIGQIMNPKRKIREGGPS